MATTREEPPKTSGAPEEPGDERPSAPPGSHDDERPRPSMLLLVAMALIIVLVGLALLMLGSVLVVYATGAAARRLGLPELHVMIAFLGLLALLSAVLLVSQLASAIAEASRTISSEIADAGRTVADEMNGCAADFTRTVEDLPCLIVNPEMLATPGRTSRKAPRHPPR